MIARNKRKTGVSSGLRAMPMPSPAIGRVGAGDTGATTMPWASGQPAQTGGGFMDGQIPQMGGGYMAQPQPYQMSPGMAQGLGSGVATNQRHNLSVMGDRGQPRRMPAPGGGVTPGGDVTYSNPGRRNRRLMDAQKKMKGRTGPASTGGPTVSAMPYQVN